MLAKEKPAVLRPVFLLQNMQPVIVKFKRIFNAEL